jgi:hypothetical protein
LSQIVGGAEARWASPYYGHPFLFLLSHRRQTFYAQLIGVIGGKPLEVPDGYRLFYLTTATFAFTGMVTYSTADRGERITLFDQAIGFNKLAILDQTDISWDVEPHGASVLTSCPE